MPSGEHLKTGEAKPNEQLYQNSGLQALFDTKEDKPTDFFNSKEPNLQIKHEKPEHRHLLWMKAIGRLSNREIARMTDYSEAWLSQLFRQPWARDQMSRMLEESGKDVMGQAMEFIASEAMNSLNVIVDIRDDPLAPAPVRRACAVDIVEQFLGKAKQKVDVNTTNITQSVEDIDKELESLDKEANRLQGIISE